MKPNQSPSSTNYSQQTLPVYMGNQLSFTIDNNFFQQFMNMKQEFEQLKTQNLKLKKPNRYGSNEKKYI